MNEILTLSVLVFVVASMLALGLSLTMQQILTPLRNLRLVLLALLANFVLVPLLAYLIQLLIPLNDPIRVGLILLATAAGAPFLPKLVQVARSSVAFSVGLMVLLMVTTILYMPLVLPLLVTGVAVNPWDIARSLIVLMLIPLAAGLLIKARYPETAGSLLPPVAQASNVALVLLGVLALITNFSSVVGFIGTGGIVALFLFIAGSFILGYVLAGGGVGTRSVMGLGTAQRNVSAAFVVGGQNFSDPDVVITLVAGALLMLTLLMVTAGELGRRSSREGSESAGAAGDQAPGPATG